MRIDLRLQRPELRKRTPVFHLPVALLGSEPLLHTAHAQTDSKDYNTHKAQPVIYDFRITETSVVFNTKEEVEDNRKEKEQAEY